MTHTLEIKLGRLRATVDHTGAVVELALGGGVVEPVRANEYGAPLQLLDGLTLGWRHASDVRPTPLEPLTAQLQLQLDDVRLLFWDGVAHELNLLNVDDLAFVRVLDTAGTVVAAVYGRVGDVAATQARVVDGRTDQVKDVTVFDVVVVDHTATSDEPVSLILSGSYSQVFGDLSDAAGIPVRRPPNDGTIPGVGTLGSTHDRELDDAGLISELREYLQYMVVIHDDELTPQRGMLQLAPIADPETGELGLLSLHRLYPDDDPAPIVVPAGAVDLGGGTWRRQRSAAVNTWTVRLAADEVGHARVTYRLRSADYLPGDPVTRQVIEPGEYVTPDDWTAEAIARAYRAYRDGAGGWERDAFVYRPADVDELGTSWFPNWSSEVFDTAETVFGGEWAADCFRRPVTVTGIPDAVNLARVTYTGWLRAVDITFSGGRPVVTFSLWRTVE